MKRNRCKYEEIALKLIKREIRFAQILGMIKKHIEDAPPETEADDPADQEMRVENTLPEKGAVDDPLVGDTGRRNRIDRCRRARYRRCKRTGKGSGSEASIEARQEGEIRAEKSDESPSGRPPHIPSHASRTRMMPCNYGRDGGTASQAISDDSDPYGPSKNVLVKQTARTSASTSNSTAKRLGIHQGRFHLQEVRRNLQQLHDLGEWIE